MIKHPLFINRVGVLATMHQKQQVIAPILEQELGIKVIVPQNFDTDRFGTFTREVKRLGNQLEAAKHKAIAALEITRENLGFASEGTFGPHPVIPFIPCNREIVVLVDLAQEIVIFGQEFSTETNFKQQIVKSVEEAFNFADEVGFPTHGLVVMINPAAKNKDEIIKGITTKEQLRDAVKFALNQSIDRRAYIETDMRASYNPTRMKNIEKATLALIKKINHSCPKCGCPGFEVIERKKGLRCAVCNSPTENTLSAIYQCQKCEFIQENLFPDQVEKADPSHCMLCNP